jgi:hypothetical protein
MTNLSPATQAIIDASNCAGSRCVQLHIADALVAVADQVVPENANPVGDEHDDARLFQWMRIRSQIRAIAAELEAQ